MESIYQWLKIIWKRGLPEIVLLLVLMFGFFQFDLITEEIQMWLILGILILAFVDGTIKIILAMWKFVSIEITITKMEKMWITKNYGAYREELKPEMEVNTMQDLLVGLSSDSLKAIKSKLQERVLTAETKKKKKYIKRQIKSIDKELADLKKEQARALLADVCAEKTLNGIELVEKGVTLLNETMPKTEPEIVKKKQIEREKN